MPSFWEGASFLAVYSRNWTPTMSFSRHTTLQCLGTEASDCRLNLNCSGNGTDGADRHAPPCDISTTTHGKSRPPTRCTVAGNRNTTRRYSRRSAEFELLPIAFSTRHF